MSTFTVILNSFLQLFSKLECDEMEILEHTKELLEELGPGEAKASEEREEEEDHDGELEDSDSEQLEEQVDRDNMDLS